MDRPMTSNSPPIGRLAAEERCLELATLLARGVLRWHGQRETASDPSSKNLGDSARQGLELSGPTRLSGTVGERS